MMDLNYENLKKYDIVGKLEPLRRKGGWYWSTETGKFTRLAGFDPNLPWISIRREPEYKCKILHEIMFKLFNLLPPFCLNCWKVVAKPKTVEELIICLGVMKELDLPSNAGATPRPNVFGLYQCYFYNPTLKKAKEVEELVKSKFPPMPIYTKRYCTEFEEKFGPSDKARATQYAAEIQAELFDKVDYQVITLSQPDHLLFHIVRKWLELASQAGDESVLKFNDGKPIAAETVKY